MTYAADMLFYFFFLNLFFPSASQVFRKQKIAILKNSI